MIEALCRRALEATATTSTRARSEIAITTCRACQRSWQHGAGAPIEIDNVAVERAACDAQHLGATEAAVPARAVQDVTPATRRLVLHRDHGRCTVPGCRSARALDLHHIVPRSEGGSHDASNIAALCSIHHRQLHDGVLTLTGRAPDELVFTRVHARAEPPGDEPVVMTPPDAADPLAFARVRARAAPASNATPEIDIDLARGALRELGIRGKSAQASIRAALAGGATTVEAIIRFALRQVGTPAIVIRCDGS